MEHAGYAAAVDSLAKGLPNTGKMIYFSYASRFAHPMASYLAVSLFLICVSKPELVSLSCR
jgi:hypothetical protein